MAEYMYSAVPMPNIYVRARPSSTATNDSPVSPTSPHSFQLSHPTRSNSTAEKPSRSRRSRFRHTRTSSTGSNLHRPSHEQGGHAGLLQRRDPAPADEVAGGGDLSSSPGSLLPATGGGAGAGARTRKGEADTAAGPSSPVAAADAQTRTPSDPRRKPASTKHSQPHHLSHLTDVSATNASNTTSPEPPAHKQLQNPNQQQHQLPPRSSTSSNRRLTKLASAGSAPFPHQKVPNTPYTTLDLKNVAMLSDQEAAKLSKITAAAFSRTESISSTSGHTSLLSKSTMTSSDPSASVEAMTTKPFTLRNGRTYLTDSSIPYPLPVDLTELHRQSLRTLLLIQVFGGPVCSPSFATRAPSRVLEIGCGSGFWSMMCHRYFRDRGHTGISFTGLDIAPLAPGSSKGHASNDLAKPDRDMRWRFVQHDMRLMPFPFADDEFDLVMIKDMSLATTNSMQQRLMDEYLRILRPGGCLEIWESDHTVRMLRPHVPDTASAGDDDDLREDAAALLGAYVMSANTPLSGPLNNFLMEYNGWLARALESRDLSPVPCTLIGPMLLQESDALTDVRSRRLAVPLGEVRWEKEGIGGVVTKDGKSFIDTKGKGKGLSPGKGSSPSKGSHSTKDSNFSKGGKGAPKGGKDQERKLTAAQAALRRTALLTIVQHVQSLESVLREVSGKSQDEWDGWIGKMMGDLVRDGGTSWGECLEVGAWWARKKS